VSADDLQRAEADEAFAPALRFAELALDHVPVERLGAGDIEGRLTRRVVEEPGVHAVCGPSGAGKSSVIASVLANVATTPGSDEPRGPGARHVLPLRIPVAPAGESAVEPETLGRIAIGEVLRAARDELSGEQRRRAEQAAASQTTRRAAAAAARFHFDLKPIPGLTAGLATELRAGATELLRQPSASAVLGGLDDLLVMLRAHGRWPVLVIEDTDQWARRPDGGSIADRFFSQIIHALAREIDASTVIAVQDVYKTRRSFREIRDLIWTADLPHVADPAAALRIIIGDRIERYLDPPGDPHRVVDDTALTGLADIYRRSRDLRRTLRMLRDAIELAGPDFPPALTFDHIVAAAP
jgi:hypothetical protein